jgi:hypothetical protein
VLVIYTHSPTLKFPGFIRRVFGCTMATGSKADAELEHMHLELERLAG